METLTILVIDDDAMTCSLLETVLQLENYQTASASHIEDEDIISLLNRENPHILILDFHLGSKDALEYVSIIRANTDWKHLPILVTSAIDLSRDCLEAGANDFVLKPFNWQEMTKSVNRIHDNSIHKEV
jgi:DNA-binding response OmpR family regulator